MQWTTVLFASAVEKIDSDQINFNNIIYTIMFQLLC